MRKCKKKPKQLFLEVIKSCQRVQSFLQKRSGEGKTVFLFPSGGFYSPLVFRKQRRLLNPVSTNGSDGPSPASFLRRPGVDNLRCPAFLFSLCGVLHLFRYFCKLGIILSWPRRRRKKETEEEEGGGRRRRRRKESRSGCWDGADCDSVRSQLKRWRL